MSQTKSDDFAFPTADKHDAPPETTEPVPTEPTEAAIDQGVTESFPASDPVSVSITKIERKEDDGLVPEESASPT